MNRQLRAVLGTAMTIALVAGTAACNDFLTVDNIGTVDAGDIDPLKDASTLSQSSLQDFAAAYSSIVMYMGWFTGETIATETFQGPNDFTRRDIPDNGDVNGSIFAPLSRAIVSSGRVIDVLKGTEGEASNVDLARAELVAGYSFEFMAEQFCVGAVRSGAPLDSVAMLDSAKTHFSRAIEVGQSNGTPEGVKLANAALVGLARAELQAGDKPGAAADAASVPDGFELDIEYFDDVNNRDRVSNQLWQRTFARGSISVSEAFRALDDPRVVTVAPGDGGFTPQDGVTPFYAQTKYTSYAAPIRLASKLEADYIAAEAGSTADQLSLIDARRTANGLGSYSGPTDAQSVLTELMTQKSLDFFLEGKRLGDFRRNGSAVQNMPVPGTPYFKAGYDPVGDDTCYPLPLAETSNNPNF
ncbi:MAG TPA: hypothetical protein VIP79_10285 [Gemmatimonadaceae bacterium]